MTSQYVWIAIVIGVFFVGIGVSYTHFSNIYNPMSMKFQNQELFDQMMSNNPRMSQQWMDSGMMNQQMMNDPQTMQQWMDTMMNDPQMQQQMMTLMMNNQDMMHSMMNNHDMMNMLNSGMMGQHMSGQNENKQTETVASSYVKMIDGVQVVTVNAKEFKFMPSEIQISPGETKFIMVNNGVAEHELVVYDISKKDIVDKAELAEDEETITKNILFEIDHTPAGESGETDVMNLQTGSYVIGCHIPGHYEAGMKGTLEIKE